MSQFQPDSPATPAVNAQRLWAGGAATALVAALAAVVGLLIVRGILDTPVITPERMPGNSQAGSVALSAAIAALVATALLHALMVSTPRASNFFAWIGILATIATALWPFTIAATTASRVASAAIYFVVGIAIVSLLTGVAGSAQTTRRIGV
ncbi:DUF6069 family protein [Rhodococcus sp. IEGM 1406]|uniref:DUF6069 family protein n=1 Tax=Rhodococcus sp. IEGM 1406 TaxID=3047083 RepID=UPI0024B6DA69|nr:DUF6069 family protein [Rhodococcus sp. IEGM 1406]MDI9904930.1 DUF6069 family protein [Rhodococcus sp. IEGM 1406]